MTYYVSDPEQHHSRRRQIALIAIAAAVTLLVLVAGLVIARPDTGPAAPGGMPVEQTLTWATVGRQPVPVSSQHGPRDTAGGVARGFTHDALGAALAAIHISARLSGEVGPEVYEAVARQQCVGDVEAALAAIRGARSVAPAGAALPEAYYYKITAGDPGGDQVLVSLAVSSPQGRGLGGFVGVLRTLRWVNGDWRLQVPTPAPQVIGSVEAYTLLGGPGNFRTVVGDGDPGLYIPTGTAPHCRPVYQFRHVELQDHLASPPPAPSS